MKTNINITTPKRKAGIFAAVIALGLMMLLSVLTATVLSGTKNAAAAASGSVWDGSVATGFAGGDGQSADTAWEISNGAELAFLAQEINAGNGTYNASGVYYKLTQDIVLNDTANWTLWNGEDGDGFNESAALKAWTPIGMWISGSNNAKEFQANFDGCGFTVSGIYINKSTSNDQGLFGGVYDGKIRNVGTAQSFIKGKDTVGGVAAYTYGGASITNCYNTGKILGADNIGGVVGQVNTGGKITNCYNTGAVTGTGEYVGGVAGNVYGSLTNCYNTGSVSGSSSIGGVAGYVEGGNITNCYNTGAVTGNYVGGVAGYVSGSVTNSYYLTGCVNGNATNDKGTGNGMGTTAVFNASGVIKANSGITEITINAGTTTLLETLNAWVALPANSGGGYNTWYGTPFPTFEEPAEKAYEYTITKSGTAYSVSGKNDDGSTYTVGSSGTDLAAHIAAIKADAGVQDCTIVFGDGTNTLDIGSASVTFDNTGWGLITLQGKITGNAASTISVQNNVSINSYADISNSNSGASTINYSGNGTLSICDGTVSATRADGITISNNSTGKITVSGTATVTSANALSNRGTIYLADSGTETDVRLEITGGKVQNTFSGIGNLQQFRRRNNSQRRHCVGYFRHCNLQ